jgi:hypothetical protein
MHLVTNEKAQIYRFGAKISKDKCSSFNVRNFQRITNATPIQELQKNP